MADSLLRSSPSSAKIHGMESVSPRIRRLPYDKNAVTLIAEVLDAEAMSAPFRLPNAEVFQIVVTDLEGRAATMLTLWPSIHRVDIIRTGATIVFTDVRTVDLVPDVEVQFRRSSRELVIVARGGKVIVRA